MRAETRFLIGLIGIPILIPIAVIGYFTPRYVPNADMVWAIASTDDPRKVRRRIVDSFTDRCAADWQLDARALDGTHVFYSWENDHGLLARTELRCEPGGSCSVSAGSLLPPLLAGEVGGEPLPGYFWGCSW